MILYCPVCGTQHIDAPDDRTAGWTNPPHRSHLCHGCGCIWRPADVATVGVAKIETRGKADTFDQREAAQPATVPDGIPVHEVKALYRHYVNTLESARDQIVSRGGECDAVDVMERRDPVLARIRNLLAGAPQPEARMRELAAAEQSSYVGAGAHGIPDVPEAQAGADVTDAMIDAGYAAMHRISFAASPRDRLTAMWVAMNAAMPKPAEGGAVADILREALESRGGRTDDDLVALAKHCRDRIIDDRDLLAAAANNARDSAEAAGSGEAVATVLKDSLEWTHGPIAFYRDHPPGTKLYAGSPPASGQGEALESLQEFVPYVQKHGHARKGYVVGMRKKSRSDELDEVETYYSKGAVLALVRRIAGGEGE